MKKEVIVLVVVLVFSLLASWSLFNDGYFRVHDGLLPLRQLEMEKCLLSLQIPCRWAPDMTNGYGHAHFNYYPPLPYVVGEIFRLMGLSFLGSVKASMVFSFVLSGIFMYLLAKEIYGKIGGVLSSIFYVWGPYRATDIYVRGALNESWVFVWFAGILWALKRGNYLLLSIFLSFLFISHNTMALIFLPFLYLFIALEKGKRIRGVVSSLFGICLSAYFVIPAFFEKGLTGVENVTSGYFNFADHFASINQVLISRFWGYGLSFKGDNDGMSFQVGQVHWVLGSLVLVLVLLKYISKRRIGRNAASAFIFALLGWFSIFMTLEASFILWKGFSILRFVQFPWRFLALATFFFSLSAPFFLSFVKNIKARALLVGAFAIFIVVFNWNYFRVEKNLPLKDKEVFSSPYMEQMQLIDIEEFLPKTVVDFPGNQGGKDVEVLEGEGQVYEINKESDKIGFKTDFKENGKIRLNIFYFPNWKVYSDNKEIKVNVDLGGRINFDIEKGQHDIKARFTNTPLRAISNVISLLSWATVLGYLLKKVL